MSSNHSITHALRDLLSSAVKREPVVYFRRVILYEHIEPKPIPIRDITFRRGNNIIWAEDSHAGSQKVSGHSVGKTTLCRLLRYLLGEPTIAAPDVIPEIRKAFPVAYVAAELIITGRKWAVLRPLKSSGKSYIMQDTSIEQLVTSRLLSTTHKDYTRDIGLEATLDRLATIKIPGCNALQWGHVLAWCSRDQEISMQCLYAWRSSRSGAGAPTFSQSKIGPLALMRLTLGLYSATSKDDDITKQTADASTGAPGSARMPQQQPPVSKYAARELCLRRILANVYPTMTDISQRPYFSGRIDRPDLCTLSMQAEGEKRDLLKQLQAEINVCIDQLGATYGYGDAKKSSEQGDNIRQDLLGKIQRMEKASYALGAINCCRNLPETPRPLPPKGQKNGQAGAAASKTDEQKEAASVLPPITAEQNKRCQQLSSIYADLVRYVLSGKDYSGLVRINRHGEITFDITKGAVPMQGATMVTIANILADYSCLLYNAISDHSHFPGILIMDSPRRADMTNQLYQRLLTLFYEIEQLIMENDVPYQLIITTTTAPPEVLQSTEAMCLRLNSKTPDGYLFRCDLAQADRQAKLPFDAPKNTAAIKMA